MTSLIVTGTGTDRADDLVVDIVGGNEAVYPHLEAWEWPIAAYLFIGGLAAGLMIFAGVLGRRSTQFRRSIAIADRWTPFVLVVGLLLLWVDLANRWNVWRLYLTFRTSSAMSWGSWILAVAVIVAAVRFALHAFDLERAPKRVRGRLTKLRHWGARSRRALDLVTIAVGIGVGLYTGVLLSSISARPLWDSSLLAPLFLVSGTAAGGALLLAMADADTRHVLAPASIALGGVELALLAAYLFTTGARAGVADSALDTLSRGGYGLAFWGLVVAAGLVIPLSIEIFDRFRPLAAAWSRTASALTLTGSAALRAVILFGGLASVA
ncbi:MAG: polysulfide reductase NrfD [Ilumatobacter sp.]|uniref:NrfD/PsrC family molybdoenzyme membrane anchor subunit n=1 Tax=Ilumatobacter sp. TaxID=1967498 RepID=UPI00262E34E1|nr:NrfD/PsrC family molybdoenzyme membrane anchor subunit [Ilumatobacter sp.]MDJ0768920.1 polysulfide reductase NrfD [Ilumatobacter sp.]